MFIVRTKQDLCKTSSSRSVLAYSAAESIFFLLFSLIISDFVPIVAKTEHIFVFNVSTILFLLAFRTKSMSFYALRCVALRSFLCRLRG